MWTFQRAGGGSQDGALPSNALRRGFCPSVWTPMESGDGLIVRLHAPHAGLSATTLRALARAAAAHGNGLVEITRRAKLQVRGIRVQTLEALQAALSALGLAERSALTVNPLAGLDPSCAPLSEVARDVELALAHSDLLRRLSHKFGIVLDSGALLRELDADIRVELAPRDPGRAILYAAATPLATLAAHDSGSAVIALARVLANSGCERMRDYVRAHGTSALSASLAAWSVAAPQPTAAGIPELIGFRRGHRDWLGAGLAFGSADASQWLAIADLAERFGTGEIRITPFRSLVLPGVSGENRPAIEALARTAGLILDPAAPLLRAIACPGRPACGSALGETRTLARELLPLLAAGARLHVSGCSKGCASRGPAQITVVHDAAGSRLGFGLDVTKTAATPALSLETLKARLANGS